MTKEVHSSAVAEIQPIEEKIDDIVSYLQSVCKYKIAEVVNDKPWGGFVRLEDSDSEEFIGEFFSSINYDQASLGNHEVKLSPKILIVSPGQRLSWQKHDRRAELWHFLTPGAYYKSDTDEMGELQYAKADEEVEFVQGERHRLVALDNGYVIVAEIWRHEDPNNPSDEDDITRIEDDYSR